MPSPTEALAAAAFAALATVPHATLTRGSVDETMIGPAGLINLVEGEAVELDELLGGAREMVLPLDLEIAVAVPADAARAVALDALAALAAAAILADGALGALVDHRRVNPLRDRQDIGVNGAATIRTATLPVELYFSTGKNPLA